jgi:NADPH:quinone reductase-like Zn-dependent oxidoreductase
MRYVRLQGIEVGSREMFEEMNRTFERCSLRPIIHKVFGFEDAVEAFRCFAEGLHFGKICVRVTSETPRP